MLELDPSFHLPDSHSSYPLGEHFHSSNQVFRLGMEEESSAETKLGGHVKPLETMVGVIFASNHVGGKIPTSHIMLMGFLKHSLPIGFELA